MKKTFYFPHDFNARNDEKILRLRIKHGMLGYGVYFALLERLGESTDYMSVVDYNIIAYDLRVDASAIKSVINDFGLFAFTQDGECFYSESLIARMKPFEALHEQRKNAGIKSAEKRRKTSHVESENDGKMEDYKHADNQPLFNDRSTTVEQTVNGRCQNFQQKEENKENKGEEITRKYREVSIETSLSDFKKSDLLPDAPETPSRESNVPSSERIDYGKLANWFNEKTKGCFGTIRLPLGEQRKKMLRARFAEHGKSSFVEVVENALKSDFLRGQNRQGWRATFDWLIKPSNYEKVLSENYKNTEKKENDNRKNCSDEELLDAVAQGYARAAYNKAKREGRTPY
jgi:hypothetical protein